MTRYLSSVKANETAGPKFASPYGSHMQDRKPFQDIAERLIWHRKEIEGLTQADYARKAGLKRSQVNNWESGAFRLSIDGALQLRQTFGLSLDFLYEGIDDALPMTLRQAWRDRP